MRYHTFWGSCKVLAQFLHRDVVAHVRSLWENALDYIVCYPLVYILGIGYMQVNALFGTANPRLNTIFFAGQLSVMFMIVTFERVMPLLFDLDGRRFVDYQLTILNAQLVLFSRVLFSTLYTFVMTLPFYPVTKLVLGTAFVTTNASWLALIWIIFLSSLCTSSFHLMAICLLKSTRGIESFWTRINYPLLMFGGVNIPLAVISGFSPYLGMLAHLNPFLYMTEGLRQALVGGPEFIPFWGCTFALIAFSAIFFVGSSLAFKRRTDHI